MVFLCLFLIHASGLGRLLMLISYLGSIIKGHAPTLDQYDWYWINGRGRRAYMYRTKE